MPQVTILELARRLGLSKSSISVALRGKPGISAEVRARVLAEARRLGYKPNPVAAELMAMVRSRKRRVGVETVAFINAFRNPEVMNTISTFHDFLAGAREQAEIFGYRLEEFAVHSAGMTVGRLERVLKARGIRGVLLGPPDWMGPEVVFDWDGFSFVVIGVENFGVGIHRVCSHHSHGALLAIKKLAERGYRRIGTLLIKGHEPFRGYSYQMGVDEARRQLGPGVEIISGLLAQWDDSRFIKWVEENKLDAVVSLSLQAGEPVRGLRTAAGEPVGYVNLGVTPGTDVSGINQHSQEIGQVAMDLLRSLLHAGERGVAPRPRIVLIEGEWVEGTTAPPLKDAAQSQP